MDADATSDRSILHKTLLRRYRLLQYSGKAAISYLPHAPCKMYVLLTSVKRQICTVIYHFKYNGHYIIPLAVTPKKHFLERVPDLATKYVWNEKIAPCRKNRRFVQLILNFDTI